MPEHYSRVSQGGEGRIRRVSPEESRRMNLAALRERRGDIATQRGWDLAHDTFTDLLRDVSRYFSGDHVNADVVLGEIRRRLS